VLRVGILLAGCGAHDGSDIHETVLAALALERALMRIVYLAPERAQSDVVDHAAGAVDDAAATRHLLVESARLARGRVEPLGAESVSDLAAIVVPGGLGVLKNLFVDVLVPGRRARPGRGSIRRGGWRGRRAS
jgi:enhancing lycopene biosynthesis protein 2